MVPFWPAVLAFGATVGVRLNILLLYVVGVVGMFCLCRTGAAGEVMRRNAVLTTVIYAASPLFVETMASGNFNELMAFTFPAILFAAWKGIRSRIWFVAAAFFVANIAFFGKYSFVWVLAFVAVAGVILAWRQDTSEGRRAIVIRTILLMAIASGMSAVKTVPMADLILGSTYDVGGSTLHVLKPKYYAPLIWTGIVFGLVSLYSRMSGRLFRRPVARLLVPALALAGLAAVNVATLTTDLESAPTPVVTASKSFHQVRGIALELDGMRTPHSNGYLNFLRGVGTIDWYDDWVGISSSTVPAFMIDSADAVVPNPEYRGEAWIAEPAAGRVDAVIVAANRIGVSGFCERPGRLVLNFNYLDGWRCDHALSNHGGLIAVDLDRAGPFDIDLEYLPSLFLFGLAVSLISVSVAFAAPPVHQWTGRGRQ